LSHSCMCCRGSLCGLLSNSFQGIYLVAPSMRQDEQGTTAARSLPKMYFCGGGKFRRWEDCFLLRANDTVQLIRKLMKLKVLSRCFTHRRCYRDCFKPSLRLMYEHITSSSAFMICRSSLLIMKKSNFQSPNFHFTKFVLSTIVVIDYHVHS